MLERETRLDPRSGRPPGGAPMTTGLILLVFIALLVAFGWARFRRRLGMSTSGRAWLTVMVIVVLGVLALWASSAHG
jgi:hypothetical protein